jgi:hypothetical protein
MPPWPSRSCTAPRFPPSCSAIRSSSDRGCSAAGPVAPGGSRRRRHEPSPAGAPPSLAVQAHRTSLSRWPSRRRRGRQRPPQRSGAPRRSAKGEVGTSSRRGAPRNRHIPVVSPQQVRPCLNIRARSSGTVGGAAPRWSSSSTAAAARLPTSPPGTSTKPASDLPWLLSRLLLLRRGAHGHLPRLMRRCRAGKAPNQPRLTRLATRISL